MPFQALGLDSRYTSVVQVNNVTEGSFQQDASRTYDVGISTSASIPDASYSDSSVYVDQGTTHTIFNDRIQHFTGDISITVDVSLTEQYDNLTLYINGDQKGYVQSQDAFNKTRTISGSVSNAPIQSARLESSNSGNGVSVNYTVNISYDSPVNSSYSVTGVAQE